MARNSEKAMTALARWRNMKEDEERTVRGLPKEGDRRPHLASMCHGLKAAQLWRRQVIREIAQGVSQIQNAGLGEFRLRDLNDQINKLLREKRHWEQRIVELGGRDLSKSSRILDKQGKEVPGNRGYRYFGAARNLPGVRELFDSEGDNLSQPQGARKTRSELMRHVDSRYYGMFDDEDSMALLQAEQDAEVVARRTLIAKWYADNRSADLSEDVVDSVTEADDRSELGREAEVARKLQAWQRMNPIPTADDIRQALLDRKKQDLIRLYALDEFED